MYQSMAEKLTPRHLTHEASAALAEAPVVFLGGPRQSGKSTLAQQLIPPSRYVTLDDPAPLAAATSDPDGFVGGLAHGSAIDEVQRAPDLLRAIKAVVDRDRRPGRFLLTGSADVFAVPRVAESLAGRMRILTLWPFAEAELTGSSAGLVDALFKPGPIDLKAPQTLRADVVERAARGGYPEVLRLPAERRDRWFESYIAAITLRDVRELADVRGVTQLPQLLRLLAARASTILNAAELSRSSGIPQSTLGRYLALLEATYILRLVPAWSGSLSSRLTKHPKVALCDSGLVTHLQGIDVARLARDEQLAGPLLENYALMEFTKLSSWSRTRPSIFHFRSVARDEVDIVLERRDGSVVGIEVKAASTINSSDFAGLRALSESLKRKFVRGVVLHPGTRVVPFADNLHSIPFAALWRE
jgi:predicted AAA+ superfamily ATPase